MEPTKGNPFADTFTDLNLEATSDFQASLQRRREWVDSVTRRKAPAAPPTPDWPIFSFSVRSPHRKSIPSKWDNAEKWLMNSSFTDSSGHGLNPAGAERRKFVKERDNIKQQKEVVAEKSRVSVEKVSKTVSNFDSFNGGSGVLLKDRFKNRVEDRSTEEAGKEVVPAGQHKDVGTEMTPISSSTTSQRHTPFETTSPARNNTPTALHGNAVVDISQLQECHLSELHLGSQYDSIASKWCSREEEEEEISKSLSHFRKESESCLRYQRKEAKIQAWVNLENAKAEAQSRKLEVKIQKMRSNLEEKLMKKMGVVHRKAEERKAEARQQHAEQMQKASDEAKKMIGSIFPGQTSCGCFSGDN